MNLVIVESPTKERTISKMLDLKEYKVISSYGHVRDLPKKSLGVNIKDNFKPDYVILPRAKKIMQVLNKLAPKSKNIFLATDFDREGEAIAWHIVQLLKFSDNSKVKRITFHEITKEAIVEALKNPRNIDLALVDGQQARRVLDRLVGYKLSPLLWKKIARGLSAGRVQSVAVRFVVEREKEIANFKSLEYWKIFAKLAKHSTQFLAELISKNNEKFEEQITCHLFSEDYKFSCSSIRTKSQADEITTDLTKQNFKVSSVIKKKTTRNPSPPFTTSTLQQDASRKLAFSSKKTMFVAQQLYEGIDITEGSVGLITYHRTDSVQIAKIAKEEAKKYIIEKIGKEYLPSQPYSYKTKTKGAQEAHETIRPTSVYRHPEDIKKYLTDEQYKLYKLIWQRFLASQIAPAQYNTITVKITAENKYLFRSAGRTLIFDGFLKIYNEDDSSEATNQQNLLPDLKENDTLELIDILTEQHNTQPPPRYNEASIIRTLEKNGIGRPSTYAPTINTILQRRYVYLQDKRFYPTDLGISINDLLKQYFNEIVDVNFTATMEEKLDEIVTSKIKWQKVIEEFYNPFDKKLNIASKEIADKKKSVLTEEKCPICNSQMYLRYSRYGKFHSCSMWPKCKGKLNGK